MKSTHKLIAATVMVAFMACNNSKQKSDANDVADADNTSTETMSFTPADVVPGTYVELNTGKEIYIIRDEQTGYATDSIAKVPVDFYVNTSTNDTLFKTGIVVNNVLAQNEDGKWMFDETKVKVDGDEIKIKDGDSKLKIDGEDSKLKDGDYKKKVDGDEIKIKDGDTKTKIEDGEVKKKKDN